MNRRDRRDRREKQKQYLNRQDAKRNRRKIVQKDFNVRIQLRLLGVGCNVELGDSF